MTLRLLAQLNVVGDHAGGGALEEIDQIRLEHSRPRPTTHGWRIIANARVVDLHQNDVAVHGGGVGQPPQRPVVEPPIDLVKAPELQPGEQEDEEGGASADEETGGAFTHLKIQAPNLRFGAAGSMRDV